MKPTSRTPTPETRVRSFIAKLDRGTQQLLRSVRAAVRKRLPTANELAYEYSHSVVLGYSPTERGIDAIVSLAARADGVALYFSQGPQLPDPKGLLLGSGKQTRFVRLESSSRVAHPDVEALIVAAIARARIPLAAGGRGRLVIRGAAATPRPSRRPTK